MTPGARCRDGRRTDRGQYLARQAGAVDVPVDGVQERVHPSIGVRRDGREPVPERRVTTFQAEQATGQPDATALQRGQVHVALDPVRAGASDQLHRWLTARGRRVGHLVDGACEPAGGLQPPVDVHPAVAARHPAVPPDREHDVAPRPGELVGDLHPRRGGAHHQHATRVQTAGVAVPVGGDHADIGPSDGVRHQGRAVGPGGDDDRAGAPRAVVRVHVVGAGRACGQAPDGRAGHDRCVERGGVPLELVDEPGGRHEAVRVTLRLPPRKTGQPAGGEQVQGVPAFAPPALAHTPAVEDDVLAAGAGEQPAHGQAGVARSDHEGVDARDAGHGVCSSRGPEPSRPRGS